MDANGVPTIQGYIFLGVFVLLEFVVPILVIWFSYSERSRFNLTSLWVHQGRIDKLAVILMLTWWTHTSSMILWTLLLKVTTTDYLTYMGWAVPIIAKMFAPGSSTTAIPSQPLAPPATKP